MITVSLPDSVYSNTSSQSHKKKLCAAPCNDHIRKRAIALLGPVFFIGWFADKLRGDSTTYSPTQYVKGCED